MGNPDYLQGYQTLRPWGKMQEKTTRYVKLLRLTVLLQMNCSNYVINVYKLVPWPSSKPQLVHSVYQVL